MKFYKFFIIAVLFSLAFSACSTARVNKTEETGRTDSAGENIENTADGEVKENTETTQNENLENKEPEKTDAFRPDLTPTETYRAYNKALKKKDAAEVKHLLSESSVRMVEKIAKEQKTTVKNLLTVNPNEPELRNEKISGNTATVEVKNEILESYDEMFFVRENGAWKVAYDKFMDNMVKKMNENQRQAPDRK